MDLTLQIKWNTCLTSILSFVGCINPYDPKFNDDSFIQGMVSSNEGWQYVSVSRTSSASNHGEMRMELLGAYCVDCRVLGGTTEKPSYWPN